VSQALTLFTTPVVYIYLDRFHTWAVRRKAARKQGVPTIPPRPHPAD